MNAAKPDGAGAIVVQKAYELTVWITRKVDKFPRSHRYTVGDRLVLRALDITEALTKAAYSTDKRRPLEDANNAVNSLRLLLRLAVEVELLNLASQEFAATKLEEIGRMAGGWRRTSELVRP